MIASLTLHTLYDDTLKAYPTSDIAAANDTTSATIEVGFKKVSKLTAQNILKKRFNVKINTDSTGHIISCYSQLNSAVDTSRQKSCQDLEGVYDGTLCKGIEVTSDTSKGFAIKSKGDFIVDGELILKKVTVGSVCSTIGAQASDSVSGLPVYCNSAPKVWTSLKGTLDCIKVEKKGSISLNLSITPALAEAAAYKGIATVSCPSSEYIMVACGAERRTAMEFEHSGGSIVGIVSSFLPDSYINASGECEANASIFVQAISQSVKNSLLSSAGYPSPPSGSNERYVRAIGTCCRIK